MKEELDAIRTWLGQGSINIFGMPFAGKDTQGQALADLFETELLGGGKILRESVIPPHVKEIMEAGKLVPIKDYLRIVTPYLSQERFESKPLILSSVGRWDGEQEGVVQAAEASNHPIKAIVLLTIPEDVARARHSAETGEDRGQRADDAPEVFDARINEFLTKTQPVIEFYRNRGPVIEVDGTAPPVEVTAEIITQLHKIATTQN